MKHYISFTFFLFSLVGISNQDSARIDQYFQMNNFEYPWEADKMLDQDSLYIFYYIRASEVFIFSEPTKTKIYLDSALNKIKSSANTSLVGQYHLTLGNYYLILQDHPKAIKNYQRALENSLVYNNKVLEADSYRSLANSYMYLGESGKYLYYSNKVVILNDSLGMYSQNASILYGLSKYYLQIGDTMKAERTAIKLKETSKLIDNYVWKPNAENLYLSVMISLRKIENLQPLVESLVNVADTIYYQNLKKEIYYSALKYFYFSKDYKKATQFYYKGNDKSLPSILNIDHSLSYYYALILKETNKIDSARSILKNLLSANIRTDSEEMKLYFYEALFELEELAGNYKDALKYYKFFISLKTAIDKRNNNESNAVFAQELELKNQSLSLKLLEKENEYQKSNFNQIVVIVLLLMISLILASIFFFTRINQKRTIAEEKEKVKRLENEKLKLEITQKENSLVENTKMLSKQIDENEELKIKLKEQLEKSQLDKSFDDILKDLMVNRKNEYYWKQFEIKFLEIYPDFFEKLKSVSSELTRSELKVLALIKLSFSSKEIANVFGIEPTSVDRHRTNSRRKLDLAKSDDLFDYLNSLHS